MDTMPEAASLPFDIVTITSLILLVERENEIQTFPESAEARYSEKTIIDDLAETGIDIDDNSKASVNNLASMGFVTINEDNEFIPRESTPKLVAVLDNLFPGMPGINLVAYFLQTLQEAVSGRKDVEQAISQFEQTLFTRGVSVSKLNKPAGSNGKLDVSQKESKPAPQIATAESERRDAYMG
jgi:DNA topoisomerase IA